MMRRVLLLSVCLFACVLVGHAAQRGVPLPSDLTGTYSATGSSPAGDYTATTEILAHGRVFEVRWTFPQGDSMYGVGFVDNGSLIVGFAVGGPGLAPSPGVGIYRAVSDKPLTLEARWTAWGFEGLSTERLIKGPPPLRAAR